MLSPINGFLKQRLKEKKVPQIHQEPYKKDLHDPDDQDGVIIHLEPDILECEVKWTLGRITTNEDSGGDEFQLSYFKF